MMVFDRVVYFQVITSFYRELTKSWAVVKVGFHRGGATVNHDGLIGVWGRFPQWGLGEQPLVRRLGGELP